jgi:hypothetical protein
LERVRVFSIEGALAKPLTEITKKDGFKWGSTEQEAFDNLKLHIIMAPV